MSRTAVYHLMLRLVQMLLITSATNSFPLSLCKICGGPGILNTSLIRWLATVAAALFFIGTATRNFEYIQTHVNSHAYPSLTSLYSWKSIRSICKCVQGAMDTTESCQFFL